MLKAIDKMKCINCGLCEKACIMDVFCIDDKGNVFVKHVKDCCSCMQCMFVCPVDAHIFVPGEPQKYNMTGEWEAVKLLMGI